jgi:hypothetical protein
MDSDEAITRHRRTVSTSTAPPGYKPTETRCSSEIWVTFAIITVPLVVLSATLVAIVLHLRVKHTEQLSFPPLGTVVDEPGVYYVRISATTLVLLASFSSTVAPTLVGFLMTLVRYPISRDIVRHSQRRNLHQLPTGYQLGLLITIFDSGIRAIWPWINYIWQTKRRIVSAVTTAGLALTGAISLMYTPPLAI